VLGSIVLQMVIFSALSEYKYVSKWGGSLSLFSHPSYGACRPIDPVEPIDPTDSVEPIDTVEPIDRVERSPRGGVLEVYMTGGSDVFFWVENLHARYFFGSRDLSRIFLGLKKIRVFFWVLSPSELFVWGIRCDQWIRKIFIRGRMKRH